jgi:hypothetical protein
MRPSYQELKDELEKIKTNLVITQDALRKALFLIKELKGQVSPPDKNFVLEEKVSAKAKQ